VTWRDAASPVAATWRRCSRSVFSKEPDEAKALRAGVLLVGIGECPYVVNDRPSRSLVKKKPPARMLRKTGSEECLHTSSAMGGWKRSRSVIAPTFVKPAAVASLRHSATSSFACGRRTCHEVSSAIELTVIAALNRRTSAPSIFIPSCPAGERSTRSAAT
jgi:hypothetical protein